ncbi:CLUMA_CG021337, isoform A [Clunio marinus]|uniref:CLUMA_CG021337, isoform A n=1 Tax=Clunio marinus TaxID=568069 RepID=A0A1J1JAD5_9DIPT|nr:CLUMA_CG021337, isoform A [Clunio marinus]
MDSEALVEELKKLSLKKDTSGIESALTKLQGIENLQNIEVKETLLELLINSNTPNINLLVSKTIAEVTKSPEQRMKFSSNDVLEKLNDLLSIAVEKRKQDGLELIIQLCRALGNIFYSNDDARNVIFHIDGGKVLIELFNISSILIENSDDRETFVKVRSGVMSNYLLGNEELSQKAIELEIIEKVKSRIEETTEGVEHLLPLLSILTEQVSDLIFKPEILILISKTLKTSTNSDIVEACLELLLCQAESDEVKLLLAREGLCEHIFKSLESYKTYHGNVDTKELVKLSCDLIVLILTGDEAMHFLDKTPLLSYMKTWLESDDIYLMTTSVLALGNFARTDEHCLRMVEHDMHFKMIEILKKNTSPESDVRLQHALLSAIRNLVIPKPNKIAVISAGLVETVLPMLDIHQPPVVFKILGTLRMLVDGQDSLALRFLQDEKIVERLVDWATKTPDMVGVNSEASRLMAWMVKNSYRTRELSSDKKISVDPLKTFININNTVDVLVKMLLSAHLVMQNEALIALTIIAAFLNDDTKLHENLLKSNIGQTLVDFIQRMSDMERTTNEIVENLNTLVKSLQRSETLKKHLSEFKIDEKLQIAPRLKELATL